MEKRFTIGADPELLCVDEYGDVIHGDRVVDGGLSSPIGVDGAPSTIEIRPAPSESGIEVVETIDRLLDALIEEIIDNLEEDKDFGLYAGSGKRGYPTGGHIHIGGENAREMVYKTIKAFDKLISMPLNKVSDYEIRRPRYGFMSDWRGQPHGWEYRTPLSWICHPDIAKGVLTLVELILEYVNKEDKAPDRKELLKYYKDDARIGYVKRFYKLLSKFRKENIKLEQIEIMQAWGKKITKEYFLWFNKDDRMDEVRLAFEDIYGREPMLVKRKVVVCGASGERTRYHVNKDVVFVPYDLLKLIQENKTMEYQVSGWDRKDIGLSYELRMKDVKLCAQIVKEIVNIINNEGGK